MAESGNDALAAVTAWALIGRLRFFHIGRSLVATLQQKSNDLTAIFQGNGLVFNSTAIAA